VKGPLSRLRRRWKDTIKMDLTETTVNCRLDVEINITSLSPVTVVRSGLKFQDLKCIPAAIDRRKYCAPLLHGVCCKQSDGGYSNLCSVRSDDEYTCKWNAFRYHSNLRARVQCVCASRYGSITAALRLCVSRHDL
jgi:hypothetical protein